MESRGVAFIACVPDAGSVRATMHLGNGVPRSGGSLHVKWKQCLENGLGGNAPMNAVDPELKRLLARFDECHTFEGCELTSPESHGIDDDTPLHIAAFNNDVDLLKELMPFVTNIDVLGDIGLTPMANAVISESLEAVVYLLSCGADPMILDEVGDSVLDIMKMRPVFNQLVEQIESELPGAV